MFTKGESVEIIKFPINSKEFSLVYSFSLVLMLIVPDTVHSAFSESLPVDCGTEIFMSVNV